jgi:uncharacterized protein
VYVGVLKFSLLIRDSHSLKDKRAVVRRIKDRVEQKFKLGIAEVGALDLLQRAELGIAVAGSDRAYVGDIIDHVVGFVRGLGAAEVIDDRRDVFVYGDDAVGWRGTDAPAAGPADDGTRTGHGDKAGADDWVPDEWREEAER